MIVTNLDLIQLRFPNRLRLTLSEACQLLAIEPATARNQICKKSFPVPIVKDRGRSYLHVLELAKFLDGLHASQNSEKKRRGPRTKSERIAHQHLSATKHI